MSSQLVILGLHRVGFPPPNAKIRGLFISPKLLSFQIWLLKRRGYKFMTLREAMLSNNTKRAVLTFDDGYVDNLTAALPLLQKHNIPATLFVITGDVGKGNVTWDEAGESLPADLLSWECVRHLRDHGWEIASHAHEHVHLDRYRESHQEGLIRRSIDEIEAMTGERPVSFAYPYGTYDPRTKRVLKRLGVQFAVTTKPARSDDDVAARDHLELTRLSLGGRHFYHYVRAFFRTAKVAGLLPERILSVPADSPTVAK
jgi:peptidoglycan/xylan/chitin deacetylase (PgdA/CDA1 family)